MFNRSCFEKQLQKRFDLLPKDEDSLFKWIDSISIADKTHKDLVETWIEHDPNSSVALVVKGRLLVKLAWKERTNAFTKDVKKESWTGMERYFKEAYLAAKKAVILDPNNYVAHYIILQYRYHYRDLEQFESYYRAIVNKFPQSTAVRFLYLSKLWPRWPGSMSKMKDELSHIKSDLIDTDITKDFENYLNYYNAFLARESKDYENCVALASNDKAYPLYGIRARCNYELENYSEVIADYSEVVKSNFLDDVDTIKLSKSLYEIGRYLEASIVMDHAIEHYPNVAYFWTSAYYYHYQSGRVTTCKIAMSSLDYFPKHSYLVKAAVACFDRRKQYRKCIEVGGNAIHRMESNGGFQKKAKHYKSIKRNYEHCLKMLKN